jgi:hypothetical protein
MQPWQISALKLEVSALNHLDGFIREHAVYFLIRVSTTSQTEPPPTDGVYRDSRHRLLAKTARCCRQYFQAHLSHDLGGILYWWQVCLWHSGKESDNAKCHEGQQAHGVIYR